MSNWDLNIVFNNGFGFYLGALSPQYVVGRTELGETIPLEISGFELLLPLLAIQLIETKELDLDE